MLDTSSHSEPDHCLNAPCVPLFAVKGLHPGPRLVITGSDDLIRALADKFWDRPEYSEMSGTLILRPIGQDVSFDRPDEVLVLDGDLATAHADFYRAIGRMTTLGMITYRRAA